MLPPDYYEDCADDIVELYSKFDEAVISDITRRIVKTGTVTETAKWQIKQAQEMGLLYSDILREIAKRTDATTAIVKALFEDAGVKAVKIDGEAYRKAGKVPVDIRQSPAMLQVLEAGYKKTLGNMKNLTLTTANTSQTAYINACNSAYMKVSSGAFSYQEAIKQAIQETAQHGTTVLYPSGHTDRIDVAVRRSVMTGLGQTCRQISLTNAEEMDCDLLEISAHSGARPSHAVWQGQIVSRSGRQGYLSLSDIGFGTGEGFGGWNCQHDWYPYFEGISTRNYTQAELDALNEKSIEYNGKMYTEYEISQIQRRYEREIRAAKREQTAYKTAVEESNGELKEIMQTALTHSNDVVKDRQAKMREFIRQTGQQRDYFREQNYGKTSKKKTLIKNFSKELDIFNYISMPDHANITPQQIYDDLCLTSYGKAALDVVRNLPQTLELDYDTFKSNGLKGEEYGGKITIYMKSCKDVRTAACTIIHECTHYKYGIGDSQWAECVCIYQELLHRRKITFGRDYLTIAEKRTIIKAVKEAYYHFNWRKGGMFYGRKKR